MSEISTRQGTSQIKMFRPVDGRALVVAADPLADRPEWLLVLAFLVGNGQTDLVAHTVCPTPKVWPQSPHKSDGVLARFAAMVPLDRLPSDHLSTAVVRSAATSELEMFVRRLVNRDHYREAAWGDEVTSGQDEKPSRTRARSDLRLARVAARYVELLGESQTPKKDLKGELKLAANTINSYLFQARERGFLTSTGQGRAGGQLTPLAETILRQAQGDES